MIQLFTGLRLAARGARSARCGTDVTSRADSLKGPLPMKSSSWLKSLRNRLTRRDGRRPIRQTSRLRLELLEDRTTPSSSPPLAAVYGNLPLAFEADQGQTD